MSHDDAFDVVSIVGIEEKFRRLTIRRSRHMTDCENMLSEIFFEVIAELRRNSGTCRNILYEVFIESLVNLIYTKRLLSELKEKFLKCYIIVYRLHIVVDCR